LVVYQLADLGAIESMTKYLLALALGIVALIAPIMVFASDITDAQYYGNIVITNNSTEATGVSVICSINTQEVISQGWLDSDIENVAVRSSSGVDVAFMPSVNSSYPWCFWAPSIEDYASKIYILYTGNASLDSTKYYFPGADGMTVSDNASLESSDNISISISGYFDTSASAVGANITDKGAGLRVYVSSSSNISVALNAVSNPDMELNSDWLNGSGTTAQSADFARSGTKSWKVTDNQGYAYQDLPWDDTYQGQEFTFSCWGYSTAGDGGNFEVRIYDGVSQTTSAQDSTTDAWSQATVVKTLADNATMLQVRLARIYAGSSYFDDAELSTDFASICVDSGEHDLGVHLNESLVGIGVDNGSDVELPLGEDLVLGLPLHHTDMTGANITSKDDNEITCTVENAVWGQTGRTFDGTNDRIDCGSTAPIEDIFDGGGTVVVWANPTTGNDGRLWDKAKNKFYLRETGPIQMTLRYEFDGSAGQWRSTVSASANSFSMYSVTYDADAVANDPIFYLNDSALGLPYDTNPTGTRESDNVSTAYIGSDSGNNYEFAGIIGEVMVYDDILTPTEIAQIYNATKWRYDGSVSVDSDEYFTYEATNGTSVPDTSDNWTFCQQVAMPYVSSVNITKGGNQVAHWEWKYSETFTDSINSIVATPTFRTASSDADVSAILSTFSPIETARAPSYSIGTAPDFISSTPSISGNFSTTPTPSNFPGAAVITDVSNTSGTPAQLPWSIIVGFTIIVASLLLSWLMRNSGARSVLVKMMLIGVMMGIFTALGLIDFWMVVMFLIIAVAAGFASRQISLGDSIGSNLVGFLAMAFTGLTLINRILEGAFIASADISFLNKLMFTQIFNLFGLFPVPIINFSFFTDGLPKLVQWDYSYFGGNAAIIQYMLYSMTAVLSIMLFAMIIGLLSNYLNRLR